MPISSQPPHFSNYSSVVSSDAKSADPDIVLVAPSTLPVDIQAQLVLHAIGGSELIQIIRNDMVNGQDVEYKPIKDIDAFASEFSPISIAGWAPNLRGFKAAFGINLDLMSDHGPEKTGPVFVEKNRSAS